ncbi:hypothetical protein Taro_001729 [Colocasia esculenta]|uniref:Uncharacterized protein n=1 Tax=Colocasia esculenta TaxID=4460 RepID=A0A843TIS3_COLES|nr:hypothetical protein [Colocasia esculenta]
MLVKVHWHSFNARGAYGVWFIWCSRGLREVLRGWCVVHVVSVYVVFSLTPSVDTSSVGSPRFCVSQARECSGLVPVLGTDEVVVVYLDSTVLCTYLVEQQLDPSSVAARLRGSFPTEPVTREAHPYILPGVVMAERRNVGVEGEEVREDPTQRMIERIRESLIEIRGVSLLSQSLERLTPTSYQVREIRRFRARRLVEGQHHQQCNFTFMLFTSGYAPDSWYDIPCEASARSWEADSS